MERFGQWGNGQSDLIGALVLQDPQRPLQPGLALAGGVQGRVEPGDLGRGPRPRGQPAHRDARGQCDDDEQQLHGRQHA